MINPNFFVFIFNKITENHIVKANKQVVFIGEFIRVH